MNIVLEEFELIGSESLVGRRAIVAQDQVSTAFLNPINTWDSALLANRLGIRTKGALERFSRTEL